MLGVGLQRGSSGDEHESSSPQRLGFWHHSSLIRGGTQFPTNVFHSWWMRQQGADSKTNYASYLWGMQSRPEVRYNKETDVCVCVQQSVCDIRLTDSEGNCSCREKDWFRGRSTSCPDQASGHPITTSPFLSRSLCVSAVGLFMPSGLGDPAGT